MRDELAAHPHGARYLVPTVGHKRSIEQLLLGGAVQGLLGDPVTTFFNFAEEVAVRARIPGRALTEVQKFLMLKRLLRETTTEAYQAVKRYPGFLQALREAIDEMKVHMIRPEDVAGAAVQAGERGLDGLARKLADLADLYGNYQTRIYHEHLYDSEGIMWIAAEALERDVDLYADLRVLVLDGFTRLTPVQVEFIRSLASRVPRIIVLLDYDRRRIPGTYHPVLDSIKALHLLRRRGVAVRLGSSDFHPRPPWAEMHALHRLQQGLFHTAAVPHPRVPGDLSLQLFAGATPAHEAEMIARAIHALLRDGLPGGVPVAAEEIAILARGVEGINERIGHALSRAGIPFQRPAARLAHTALGRALLGAFALVKDGWERERVIALLKSGFLPLPRDLAFHVDMIARTVFLAAERAAWTDNWPDDETRAALTAALQPLLAFDAAYWSGDGAALLDGVRALLAAFQTAGEAEKVAFPEENGEAAERQVARQAAFAAAHGVLNELQGLGALLGGYRGDELLEVITTALLQEPAEAGRAAGDGVVIRAAHATGGEKFKVVFLCDLREGAFPRHLRESAFLLDEERERDLPALMQTPLSPRRHMEEDERCWFLHAVNSATHRLVLSYPVYAADGAVFEASSFLEAVRRVAPELDAKAPSEIVHVTEFRDVVPPLSRAETRVEFIAALVSALRAAAALDPEVAAAYAAWQSTGDPALADVFHRAESRESELTAGVATALSQREKPYSATELQRYMECPFLWFVFSCLRVQPAPDGFSALDRGTVLHHILKSLYEGLETPLAQCTPEALMAHAEPLLREELAALPAYRTMLEHMRAIELETLRRMLARFLENEIERAKGRNLRAKYFEYGFTVDLELPGRTITLRGAIDRVDLTPTVPRRAVVVDYKFSTDQYKGSVLERGRVLQAPLYALAVRALLHAAPLGAEFLGLRKGDVTGIGSNELTTLCDDVAGRKLLDPADWEAYLHGMTNRIGELVEQMADGHIPLDPHTHRCPNRCQAWPVCRGEWVTLKARYLANEQREDAEQAAKDNTSDPSA